jgi:hypothetical protein
MFPSASCGTLGRANTESWLIMLMRYNLGTFSFLALALLLAACSTGPELDLILHNSDQGTITLERIPDRSFQAAHPITLPPETVARVLRGILVRSERNLVKDFLTGKAEIHRAFSDEEVAYLAPLLVDGLKRAAPDQQVGFTIPQTGGPTYAERTGAGLGSSEPPLRLAPKERTSGSLYAYGQSLYLTITQYRYRPERVDTVNMANRRLPDETGLTNWTILFTPESAKRPASYNDPRWTESTLVIDYGLLAALPAEARPSAAPAVPPIGSAPAPREPAPAPVVPPVVQEPVQTRDRELGELRKELEDIKRQLAEQEAERNAQKKRGSSKEKPPSEKPQSSP